MPTIVEGTLVDGGGRYVIVVSRFNAFVTERLGEGALDGLKRHGADVDNVTIVRVPGSFEMPLVCHRLAASGRYDAVIALGCVIRGGTAHFDYVAGEAAKGVASAGQASGVPVIFGVLTTENVEQAVERASPARMDKGGEAMEAALEMSLVLADIASP